MRSRPVIDAFIGSVLFGESAWKARAFIMKLSHRNRKPEGVLSNAYYGSDPTEPGRGGTGQEAGARRFRDRFRKSRLAFGGSGASIPALMLGNLFGGGRERLERENAALVRQVGELQACLARRDADLASARDELALVRSRTLPPDHLQIRQVGSVWGESFFAAGREIFSQLEPLFREADQPLETTPAFLDFGCGCGRIGDVKAR